MPSFYSGSKCDRTEPLVPASENISRWLKGLFLGLVAGLTAAAPVVAQVSDKPLFLTGRGLPPNVLLILDNSDSMQEGLSQGRVGLNWASCVPGPNMDAALCPAGARYEESKGSIVKRVGRNLANRYRGQVNLGLMAYQQHPASDTRDDVFSESAPRTVRWRLMHRIADARFARVSDPAFYQPDHTEPLSSGVKRFREPHPKLANTWIFYNVAVPGYWRDGTNWETADRTFFCNKTSSTYTCYNTMSVANNLERYNANFTSSIGGFTITLTDSMRQRGVTDWGQYVVFTELKQNEWRANSSPGPGFLHVPIGGTNADGTTNAAHWDRIITKLQPQKVTYSATQGNVLVNPTWPIIAAGLTPLEGTMRTARDYFLGEQTTFFGTNQGNTGAKVPLSCGVNAALWLTDGLPSVSSTGAPLGTNPVQAVTQATAAVKDFHDRTGVPTYIVGFALPPGVGNLFNSTDFPDGPLGALAKAGGTDRAYSAQSEAELEEVINSLFSRIVEESSGSASSVAANSTSLQSGTAIYQASFDSRDWSGDLRALRVRSPTASTPNVIDDAAAWTASAKLPAPASRNLITWVPVSPTPGGVPPAASGETKLFEFVNLNDGQKAALNRHPDTATPDNRGAQRVAWLRGNQQYEGFTNADFRTRTKLLGDIVHSRPLYIHNQNFGYQALTDGGNEYPGFLQSLANTTPLVAVAANDGKLHFFDARLPCANGETTDCSATGGTEVFAYVPGAVIPELNKLTSQNHGRDRKFVFDGSPRLGHVYDASKPAGSRWRRIVVGSLGRGGKAAFALDIDSKTVLWELTPNHSNKVGTIIGEPVLGRAPNGRWITVIPNGHGSADGRASLLILDTLTGQILLDWTPSHANNLVNSGNAMFTPVAVDMTGDRRIDRVYAGDIKGNLWRLDLGGNINQWGVPGSLKSGNNELPLFQARSTSAVAQAITARPAVAKDERGRLVVLFGTGKYFETGDDQIGESPLVNSFYGLIDDDAGTILRGQLQTQDVYGSVNAFGYEVRGTSANSVGNTQRGWVMDLPTSGERVVEDALIRPGNRVVFSTLIPEPSSDPCKPGGGTGWIMEISALSGSRLATSPFDLSGEGFGEESFISIPIAGQAEPMKIPGSGVRSKVGIPTRPAVIEDPQFRDREYKIPAGSSGQLMEIIEERVGAGRKTWRQLR